MDPNISAVVVALITGVCSLIAIYLQKKQEKVVSKIDKHAMFIEKEKAVKQKLDNTEREMTILIHDMVALILKTNMTILGNTQVGTTIDEDVFRAAEDLEARFEAIQESIAKIKDEHDLVIKMTSEFQREIDKERNQ